jgi:hypothetical protein
VDSISDDDSICTISFGVIRYTLLAIGTAVFLVCFLRSSYHLISLSPGAIELYMEEDMKVILSSSKGLFLTGWGIIAGAIY